MSDATPHLGLPYLAAAQAQKHVTHNEALRRLDALVQVAVLSVDLAEAPAAPAEGDRHIVAAGAAGAWAAHPGEIAAWQDGAWAFFAPAPGWLAYDTAGGTLLVHDGEDWLPAGDAIGALTALGVNTDADATNRLAVRSAAALFTAVAAADGGSGDIRVAVSKETPADTASLLFQSGFSGRAEIGLAGDDDLVVKVSPDGSAWTEALRIDKDTGGVAIPYDNAASGLAATDVQAALDELAASGGGGGGGAPDSADYLVKTAQAGLSAERVVTDTATVAWDWSTGGEAKASVVAASTSQAGVAELATDAETLAGTDAARAVTPAGLAAVTGPIGVMLAGLALGLADALNVAQFLGSSGNRVADSFDALTHVDVAGATNLDSGTAGVLKPTSSTPNETPASGLLSQSGTSLTSLANLVDGNTGTQAFHTDSAVAGAYVQIDYGSGVTKPLVEWRFHVNGTTSAQWQIQHSDNGSAWTTVATLDVSGGSGWKSVGWSAAGAHRYWRARLNNTPGAGSYHTELLVYGAGTANNLTVRSAAFTAVAPPTAAKALIRVKEVDAAAAGTDYTLEISRDGGTTWSSAALAELYTDPAGLRVVEGAELDLTGQPTGTAPRWRFKTLNNKFVEFHDAYLYWR